MIILVKKNFLKHKKVFFFVLILVVALTGFASYKAMHKSRKVDIEKLLKTESYSYLPKEAKNYIEKVYKEKGRVLLTEKNKKKNKAYLNPRYINYLVQKENNKAEKKGYGYIPSETVVDFETNKKLYKDTQGLPSKYDLRNVNGNSYVTPLKDQGNLGICWAFATNEHIESKLMVSNNQPYSSSTETFSERQLDYAMSYNGINNYTGIFGYRGLGEGSNFASASAFISLGYGTVDSSKFPYNDGDYSKKELHEVLNYANSKYEIENTVDFPIADFSTYNDESKELYLSLVKAYIITNGGAFVGTDTPNGACSIYDGSRYLINDNIKCEGSDTGHAMQIIGWDDDYEYDMCYINDHMEIYNNQTNCVERKQGKGAWILRNSWGSDSDSTEKFSYPYLAYDSQYTQISFVTELSKMSDRKWDTSANNYDYYRSDNDLSDNVSEFVVMNYSEKPDKLEKIKIYELDSFNTYKLYVKNENENYVYLGEINTTFSGIYSIDVSDKNFVINGDNFYLKAESDEESSFDFLIFTSNVENTPSAKTEDIEYRNSLNVDDTSKYKIRVYSETRNIPSNDRITYKLFDSSNTDLTSKISYENNIVAINNVNASLFIDSSVTKGTYTLKTYYNNQEIGTSKINILTNLHKISGEGTENNPYVITTPEELDMINYDLGAYYVLGNDIDLTHDTTDPNGLFYNDGYGWNPIGDYFEYYSFYGTLDGQGHSIIGLYSKSGGLFDYISNDGTKDVKIKNIKLVNFKTSEALASYVEDNYNETTKITFENISLENIDYEVDEVYYNPTGLIYNIYGEGSKVNINNIFITGNIKANNKTSALIGYIHTYEPVNISNYEFIGNADYAISETGHDFNSNISNVVTVMQNDGYGTLKYLFQYDQDVYSSRKYKKKFKDTWGSDMLKSIKRVYTTGKLSDDYEAALNNENIIVENIYKKNITELKNANLYSDWTDFSTYWKMETIDGISRIPVLKIANFEYTKFSKTNIELEVGESLDLATLITPDIKIAKNVTYTVADSNVVTLDNGVIRGKKAGTTTIHVVSNYDGYENDLTVTVQGEGYVIKFDSNGGSGTMIDFAVGIGQTTNLPMSIFSKEGYTFKGWSKTTDGDVEFADKAEIKDIAPKDSEITLYAVWEEIPEDIYKLNTYSLVGTNILTGITEETPVDDYIDNLEICSRCSLEVYDKEGNRLNYTENVGTGTTTKIFKNGDLQVEFINVVYGDVTSDGIINISDVIKIADHTVTKNVLNETEQFAANVTHDDLLTISDVIKLADHTVDKSIELWR